MAKSLRAKRIGKEEEVKQLRDELVKSDEILKKNLEDRKLQIQVGLHRRGFPQGGGMYDGMLEKMELDVRELNMQLESKFEVVNPTYRFQKNPTWRALQIERTEKNLKSIQDNIKEIVHHVEEVEKDIDLQTERIKERRIQIIARLKELGEDTSEMESKSPDYIG